MLTGTVEETRTRHGASRWRGVMRRARRMHRRLNAGVSLRAVLGAAVAAVAAGCGSLGLSSQGLSAHAAPADGWPSPVIAATFDGHGWMPAKPAAKRSHLGAGGGDKGVNLVAPPAAGAGVAGRSVERPAAWRRV